MSCSEVGGEGRARWWPGCGQSQDGWARWGVGAGSGVWVGSGLGGEGERSDKSARVTVGGDPGPRGQARELGCSALGGGQPTKV